MFYFCPFLTKCILSVCSYVVVDLTGSSASAVVDMTWLICLSSGGPYWFICLGKGGHYSFICHSSGGHYWFICLSSGRLLVYLPQQLSLTPVSSKQSYDGVLTWTAIYRCTLEPMAFI
ncbi:unnamed protein product [Arctogadus glacialis]